VLGIGTDLVDIPRFRAVLKRTPGMADRLFCAEERAYAATSGDPARPLAARFAAKEAVLKSLGVVLGATPSTEIEIVRHEDGRPELVLHGASADFAAARGAHRFLISMSHTDTLAQAVVVALES